MYGQVRLLKLEIDTFVANIAAFVVQKVKAGVSRAQVASVEVLLDSIRASKMWPKLVEMMEQNNVSRVLYGP